MLAACSEPIELDWKHELNAASSSTPLVTEEFVAVGTELGLVLVDMDGARRCFFDAHGEVISAPKTDGERIYFGSTNYIFYAIGADCTESWKYPTRDRIKSDPLVLDDIVVVSSYDGHVYALAKKTGAVRWVFPSPSVAATDPAITAVSSPKSIPQGDRRSRRGGSPKKASVSKRTPADAETESPQEPARPSVEPGDFSYSSPVLVDGTIFVGNLDGYLYALDRQTGAMRWRYRTLGPMTSTATVTDGVAFFGSNDGNLYAVSLHGPKLRWKVSTGDWVNSSPVVIGDLVVVGSNDRKVYAVHRDTGQVQWRRELQGPVVARPAPYENMLVVAGSSGDHAVHGLSLSSGEPFWKFETQGKILADPVIRGSKAYVVSTDGFLYAFSLHQTQPDT